LAERRRRLPISSASRFCRYTGVNVQNQTLNLLDSVLAAEATRQQAGVLVLDKAQETMKQQGAATVELLESAETATAGVHLDVYA
jgi:hypothetical protein